MSPELDLKQLFISSLKKWEFKQFFLPAVLHICNLHGNAHLCISSKVKYTYMVCILNPCSINQRFCANLRSKHYKGVRTHQYPRGDATTCSTRKLDKICHCDLVKSGRTWDGTGCEFESWQCRIHIHARSIEPTIILGSLRGSLEA